jgi:hypothetical protein
MEVDSWEAIEQDSERLGTTVSIGLSLKKYGFEMIWSMYFTLDGVWAHEMVLSAGHTGLLRQPLQGCWWFIFEIRRSKKTP